MSHYLNPNLSLEECRKIDQMKLDARAQIMDEFEKICAKNALDHTEFGRIHAMKLRAHMLQVITICMI